MYIFYINMYFNKNNKFYHGIMFHHFHDKKKFPVSQGSISQSQLYKLINKIGRKIFKSRGIFIQT